MEDGEEAMEQWGATILVLELYRAERTERSSSEGRLGKEEEEEAKGNQRKQAT